MSTQIGGLAGLAIMVITGSSWHHERFKRASGWQELEAQQCPLIGSRAWWFVVAQGALSHSLAQQMNSAVVFLMC